jgi:hypothetical protein
MRVERVIVFATFAASVVAAGGAARAQTAAPPAPGGERAEEAPDRPRMRGGFSFNGGVFLLPGNPPGGAFSIAGRAGVQFNHYVSLYYQNTPIVGATAAHDIPNNMRSGTVVFADYNSLLLGLTLLHMIDLAAGPSLDYVALAEGTLMGSGLATSASASTGTGIAAGAHGRVAFTIGGLSGKGPRRSGFTIGIDAHPSFLGIGKSMSLTGGLGAEWF